MTTKMINNELNTVYLAHHGILGQKWGVRRYRNKDGSLTAEGRVRYQTGAERVSRREAKKLAAEKEKLKRLKVQQQIRDQKQKQKQESEKTRTTNRVSKMSDEELNKKIERLTLEKKYRDLKADLSGTTTGKNLVRDMATSAIKNIGTQALTFAIGTAVNRALAGRFGPDVKVVNPMKGQKDK